MPTRTFLGFPDSSFGKESTCNAGDTGLIPALGRFHMLQKTKDHASQLLSPRATTTEAHEPRVHALQRETPLQ